MPKEYILRWLSEYGMNWVTTETLGQNGWGHGFRWTSARNGHMLEVDRYHRKYRLTTKAIQQLTKEQ
jgi:hypothetical protein